MDKLYQIQQALKSASSHELHEVGLAFNGNAVFANDAALIGEPNGSIPAYMFNYVEPRAVKALFTPMTGGETFGEVQKGDWTTRTFEFRFEEPTGNVAAYGDFAEGGTSENNYNWLYRQSFQFQTFTTFGDRDVAQYSKANIDRVGGLNYASLLVLEKYRNASYYYGIDGLKNYGMLNDPNLNPTISPINKTSGGASWDNATNIEIYNDFLKLVTELATKSGGNVRNTDPMVCSLSPNRYLRLMSTDAYVGSKSALELIMAVFTNLRFVQAVEMTTEAGNLVYLAVEELNGMDVATCGFTEKLRTHRLVPASSSYKQKKSAGTWGFIGYQPVGIASMLGI